jgi:hypothetical protein
MDTDLDLPFNDNTKSVNKLEILNEKIESELSKIDLHDYMSYENFDRFVSNAFLDDKNSPGDLDDIVESMLTRLRKSQAALEHRLEVALYHHAGDEWRVANKETRAAFIILGIAAKARTPNKRGPPDITDHCVLGLGPRDPP